MVSKQPVVRQIAWISIIPQIFVAVLIIGIMYLMKAPEPILMGVLVYLMISIALRRLVPSAHHRGIALFRKHEFERAIPEFEKSYDFFSRHKWIDSFRYLILLSSSRIGYREMALLNIAFCYGQIGDGAKSKEYYQRTLVEFPNSMMAKASLRMFESAERIAQIAPADANPGGFASAELYVRSHK